MYADSNTHFLLGTSCYSYSQSLIKIDFDDLIKSVRIVGNKSSFVVCKNLMILQQQWFKQEIYKHIRIQGKVE